MPIDTVKELVHALSRYPLLESSQRDELDGILKAQYTDPRILSKELLMRGWLTPFQVNHLFQGRGPELMLGPYVLLERLTEGTVGQLFKARHQHMKRLVALQVVRADLLNNPEAVERFYTEIQVVSQLSNQHVVAAYDAGPIGPSHFFAMEYLEGIDLERLVQQSGPLPVDQACDFICQAALGLQHAFERHLLHHDLKPANLLLTRSLGGPGSTGGSSRQTRKSESGGMPVIKVRNLGVTLIRQHTKHTRIQAGNPEADPAGAADYVAPEGAIPGQLDARAEVYALGCTFYFLLTGRVPFPGGSATEKLQRHQTEEPAPLEALRPEVPPLVIGIVHKMMAKQPEDRYQTPAEVAAALATTNVLAGPTTPGDTAGTSALWQRRQLEQKRRWRRLVLAAGSALVAGLLVLTWLLLGPARAPRAVFVAAPTTELDPLKRLSLVRVAANQPWQDTHLDLPAGQPILLRADGKWRRGTKEADCPADGLGTLPRERNVVQEYSAMALLGRIGDGGPPVVLGINKTLELKTGGRLFVQANDLDLKDNSGTLTLDVQGGTHNPADVPVFVVGVGEFDAGAKRVKSFAPMPFWPTLAAWSTGVNFADPQVQQVYWKGPEGHPGSSQGRCLFRRWIAEHDGVVALGGTLAHPQANGDGVRAYVYSSRSGPVGGPWVAHNNKVETKVGRVDVRRGEALDLVVDCRSNHFHDLFTWTANLQFVEGGQAPASKSAGATR